MNIDFVYLKKRMHFGRPFNFFNEGPYLLENLMPDKKTGEKYIIKTPVNKEAQDIVRKSAHEANTWRPEFRDNGMYHDQGGWPKEVNLQDEEAVGRFRNRLIKEDTFVQSMKSLIGPVEHAIKQNNAINIYQRYFENVVKEYSQNESLSQLRNIYPDKSNVPRPISHLCWSPEKGNFATCFYDAAYQPIRSNENTEAYIWNVERPNAPQTVFDSKIPIVSLEWNPVDKNFLIGGLHTGKIAYYDVRKAPTHVKMTNELVSHRDPVHSVLWINSKTGNEFFSTSTDGMVMWWDCRFLDQPTEVVVLDVTKPTTVASKMNIKNKSQIIGAQHLSNAFIPSCLQYDSSIPAKYLVGTENGYVLCGNRKGNTIAEKVPWIVKTNLGSVYAVDRNPAFTKNSLVVGDWTARIWSEDCKESAIIWTKPYKVSLMGGEWSRSRCSVFFIIRSDGVLDLWDLLQQQTHPIVSMQVCLRALNAIRVEEQGQLVVVGDNSGKCYLVHFAHSLASVLKNDKVLLSSMFERENRREKILEGRARELRLTQKLKSHMETKTSRVAIFEENEKIEQAETEYWAEVNKILKQKKETKVELVYEEPKMEVQELETIEETESVHEVEEEFEEEEEVEETDSQQ